MSDTTRAVEAFLHALAQGRVCLHPTDTVPGLTFSPRDPLAVDRIFAVKHRDRTKNFIGLVPDLITAQLYWQPLPEKWQNFLTLAWPGPLSVVWSAGTFAPESMVSQTATICLRVPLIPIKESWLYEVLRGVSYPLPTTSVNFSGKPAFTDWLAAAAFSLENKIFVPEISMKNSPVTDLYPSTIMRIIDFDNFEIIRAGAISAAQIQGWLDAVK